MSILKTTSSCNMKKQQQQQQQQQHGRKLKATTKSATTTTTCVSFHKLVKVKLTLHINDYTDEEIESCWLTPTEYDSIQKRIFMTLDLMKLLSPTSSTTNINLFSNSYSNSNSKTSSPSLLSLSSLSSSHCTRGLEKISSSCLKESTRIRR